ncbi:hypothetical protein PIB30_011863 [Stylosanthes scabra]|uniref:Pentatricopeptide repeat-containing protein n=1 Tax=Stylosanthes scabra TaxID=79078 RepID=A0ABU6U8F0_9FABA|nr:hypothetical protein [Stylosanthes scabra]
MAASCYNLISNFYNPFYSTTNDVTKLCRARARRNLQYQKPSYYDFCEHRFDAMLVTIRMEETITEEVKEENHGRFRWNEIRRQNMTEEQRQAISKLPFRMAKRCKALMRQIICFSAEKGNVSDLLGAWLKIMKPARADWLAVIKELKTMDHPLYLEVAEYALLEESFEANLRDYTKIIHSYGKNNRLDDAENVLTIIKQRGFICDQVILTAMLDMYSKAGHLDKSREYFEEIKLLGEPVDKRSYGSMIMAYIRAGMPEQGEILLQEMDAQEITAGSEIYKALLRSYSMSGKAEGAQRIFDAIQLAAIPADDKMCGLIINAYGVAGQSQKARIAFENMRRADLERDGILVGEEASGVLARWFRKLGVVEEVELILRDFAIART